MRVFTLLALSGFSVVACSDFGRVKLTLQTPESIVREIEEFPVSQLPFFKEFPGEPRASWSDWGSAAMLVSLAAGKLVDVESAWRYSKEDSKAYDSSTQSWVTGNLIESYGGFESFDTWRLDADSRIGLFDCAPYYWSQHGAYEPDTVSIADSFINKFFDPEQAITLEDLFTALRLKKLCRSGVGEGTRDRIILDIMTRRVESKGQHGFRSIYNIGVPPNTIDEEETIFGLLCLAQLENLPKEMVASMWSSFDNVLLYDDEVLGKPLFQYAGMALLKDLRWVATSFPR